jgi:flagellar biosynthesis anti-sigma factor FlgM
MTRDPQVIASLGELMRIPSLVYISSLQHVARGERAAESAAPGGEVERRTEADVQVSLSKQARALSDRGSDGNKVERLQKAIADGSFAIDPQRIAARILEG